MNTPQLFPSEIWLGVIRGGLDIFPLKTEAIATEWAAKDVEYRYVIGPIDLSDESLMRAEVVPAQFRLTAI